MHDDEEPDPHMRMFAATVDICDYIAMMTEPQRSICHAMVIEGESANIIAGRFNVTPKTIRRRTRKALAPLAVQYDIRNAVKYLPASSSRQGRCDDSTGRCEGGRGRKGTTEDDFSVR